MGTPTEQERHAQEVLRSILNHEDSINLRSSIDTCSPGALQSWRDSSGLDLLHHAILTNNVVAVGTLFSRGLFKTPHEPGRHPYLHLACHLGYKSLLIMLLQERAGDNKPALFHFPGDERHSVNCVDADNEQKKCTPLDVAAEAGHLMCVKAILDFSQTGSKTTSKEKSESYTDLACKMDSPSALRLLLCENPSRSDLQKAVALALKMARPECLDALLRHDIDKKDVFGGMNFFHVLFTYSYSFDKTWYESLLAVTSVLLRHGHSVHAFRPSRTFPLYSLLSRTHFHDLERSAPYRIACLLLLLNSRADPNFDEIKIEELVNENEYETAFGRKAYPSALHSLFDTLATYVADDCELDTVHKFMYKSTEILLNHGADVNYIGNTGQNRYGTSLHALADTSRRLGFHKQTLHLLLRRGADPNIHTDCLPLSYFCEVFYGDVTNLTKDTTFQKLADSRRLEPLLKGMTMKSLQETEQYIRQLKEDVEKNSCGNACLGVILEEIETYTRHVWSLKRSCMQIIWAQIGRKVINFGCLPLPLALKTDILAEVM
ncbi:poly [ADP-ribose] polymerase tankyrase-1-like [Haliotis asinina]|uniref:poly [ADP-ribose] polymerase tankyrase-1-like n=1 Tax=Haliotis asinina TaxID=109174 RepID=UPI00353239AD